MAFYVVILCCLDVNDDLNDNIRARESWAVFKVLFSLELCCYTMMKVPSKVVWGQGGAGLEGSYPVPDITPTFQHTST